MSEIITPQEENNKEVTPSFFAIYKKTILITVGVLVIVGASVFAADFINKQAKAKKQAAEITQKKADPKKDFGKEIPPTLLATSTLIRTTINTPEQSYTIAYGEKTQSTVVFSSTRSAKENYRLYREFLGKEGWYVVKIYENAGVYGIYAITKMEKETVNITISRTSTSTDALTNKSSVSITHLK